MTTMERTTTSKHDAREKFIADLASDYYPDDERRDRAALATLRRGVSGEERDLARVYPLVLPYMYRVPLEQRDAYLYTACLFGMHPTPPGRKTTKSLARSLRQVWDDNDQRGGIENRFIALLQSHPDDLTGHLRQAVSIVATHRHVILLTWTDVLGALLWWSNPKSSIRRRWASDFWGATSSPE